MYDRILVPTDGSMVSASAARHANAIAEKFDAEVHVLCVQERVGVTEAISSPESKYPNDEEAEDSIEIVTDRLDNRLSVVEAVVAGSSVPQKILEYVGDEDIDMIVMGTTGRTGAERFLIGSVAEKIVRQSEVPVTTVRKTDT